MNVDNAIQVLVNRGNAMLQQNQKTLFCQRAETPAHDPVNHPDHYTSHPSGIECIEVTRHFNFAIGNAIKYLWRHGLKPEHFVDTSGAVAIQDLRKAIWYIEDEIRRLQNPVEEIDPC